MHNSHRGASGLANNIWPPGCIIECSGLGLQTEHGSKKGAAAPKALFDGKLEKPGQLGLELFWLESSKD